MVSNLAYIHPDAKLGKDVVVEPFTSIYGDVVIGDGTWIGPNAVVMDGARIGNNCKIFPGAVVSAVPQDLKFAGEKTTAEIGNNTTIREAVTINRGTKAKGKTVVGNNCLIMAYTHVAHDCFVGNNCILVNNTQLAGEVEIDDFAILSGSVLVHQFVKIGAHVMISGGTKVRQDVPPYITAAHDPLAYVGTNSIGLRRRGFSNDQINSIQEAYRIIFQSKLNQKSALEKIMELPQTEELNKVIRFIEKSDRGLIKGYETK